MPLELYRAPDLGPLKKATEIFHLTNTSTVSMAVIPKQEKARKTPTPTRRSKQKKETTQTVKEKKPERGKEYKKVELNCTNFQDLIGKLKRINSALAKDGGVGVHLIEDNSKWK
ncbi:hypothetical protein PIB30_079641 [Stylosanthes scabra]|uniref:Uncharacterized protein n=1 Tax=Stylosanthes scabra TaxID=79078 RepID=A0ABU6YPZ9_9FABA|nr:hypothetical protein [Stylosanthes scabra]